MQRGGRRPPSFGKGVAEDLQALQPQLARKSAGTGHKCPGELPGGGSGSTAVAFVVQLHHLEGGGTRTGDGLGTSASPGPQICFMTLVEVPMPPRSPTKHPRSHLRLWELLTPIAEAREATARSAQSPAPLGSRAQHLSRWPGSLHLHMEGQQHGPSPLPSSSSPTPTFLMASICARSLRRRRTQRRRRLVWYIFSAGTQALGLRSGGMVMPYSQPWRQGDTWVKAGEPQHLASPQGPLSTHLQSGAA